MFSTYSYECHEDSVANNWLWDPPASISMWKEKGRKERELDPARVFLLLKTGSLSYLCWHYWGVDQRAIWRCLYENLATWDSGSIFWFGMWVDFNSAGLCAMYICEEKDGWLSQEVLFLGGYAGCGVGWDDLITKLGNWHLYSQERGLPRGTLFFGIPNGAWKKIVGVKWTLSEIKTTSQEWKKKKAYGVGFALSACSHRGYSSNPNCCLHENLFWFQDSGRWAISA